MTGREKHENKITTVAAFTDAGGEGGENVRDAHRQGTTSDIVELGER